MRVGSRHYKAYVGPPAQYDFMGATQFSLLFTLGLRANQRLLDFGCGSLRAGRLLIPYLDTGCYFGVEPNKWLVEDSIRNQIGEDLVRIKKPSFDHNDQFKVDCFDVDFDFIVAQSIFTHTGPEVTAQTLENFRRSLAPGGIAAVTFREGDDDYAGDESWIYPGSVSYRQPTIEQVARDAGFAVTRIPWFHPRQAWYLLAESQDRLPGERAMRFLGGRVLDPEFAPRTWDRRKRAVRARTRARAARAR